MKTIIYIFAAAALLVSCNAKSQDVGDDDRLPNFVFYVSNAVLYEKPSSTSEQIAVLPENKTDDQTILAVSAKKDGQNVLWYKCYYAKKNITGWTNQVNFNQYYDTAFDKDEADRDVAFHQVLAQAYLDVGSSAGEAVRLLGKPISEQSRKVGEEAATYVDGEFIDTETSLDFDGISLVYAGTLLQSAFVDKPGVSFGGIICNDKKCDKEFVLKKFRLGKEYVEKVTDKQSKFYGMEYIYTSYGIKNFTIWINSQNLVEAVQYLEYLETNDGAEVS